MNKINGSAEVYSTTPVWYLRETDAAVDNRVWGWEASGESLALKLYNDARSASAQILKIERTGNTVDSVQLVSGNLGLNTTDVEVFGGGYSGIQLGVESAIMFGVSGTRGHWLLNNAYYDGAAFKYRTTSTASAIEQDAGAVNIRTAPSGTIDTAATLTVRLTVNNTGNIGLSTTDIEAWNSSYKAMQLGSVSAIMFGTSSVDGMYLLNNIYYDGVFKYRATSTAMSVRIENGSLTVSTAPSGTIDTAATLTSRVLINNIGNLGVLTTDIKSWGTGYHALQLGATASIMYKDTGVGDGFTHMANLYYDGAWRHRETGTGSYVAINPGGVGITVAPSASANAVATLTEMVAVTTSGVIIGAPTGSYKGSGTLNAQAVYDDNVLLTCYVLEQALDGVTNSAKWHGKVPSRIVRDKDGNIVSQVNRTHLPYEKFKSRLGTQYDPLDLDKFWQHVVDKRHLTAYPNEDKYDPVSGKQDLGNWQQQTVELLEIYAVHIKKLNDRIKLLEAR